MKVIFGYTVRTHGFMPSRLNRGPYETLAPGPMES